MVTNIREKIADLKFRSKTRAVKYVYAGYDSIDEFIDKAASDLSSGIEVVLLSGKNLTDSEFLDCAKKLKQLCDMFEATFIVESRVDIAYLSGADGVNLNEEDVDIQSAKEILGEEIYIGISLNTLSDVLDLVKDGADYISVNQIPSTPTEPVIKTGLEYAKWVSENTLLPVLWFGDDAQIS